MFIPTISHATSMSMICSLCGLESVAFERSSFMTKDDAPFAWIGCMDFSS